MIKISILAWLVIVTLFLITVNSARGAKKKVVIQKCALKKGMTRASCTLLSKTGCPVKFRGTGCSRTPKGGLGDGGCQPANACSFCCPLRCNNARSFDARCRWDLATGSCFRCPLDGPADNGLPAIPGAATVLPADWSVYGLGDSFTVHEGCDAAAQFITGFNVFLAETDPSKYEDEVPTVPSRIVVFHQASGFRVGEWTGICRSVRYYPFTASTSYNGPRIYKVSCDFTSADGVILEPSQCTLPAFPPGVYDFLYQQTGSPTLGWVQTLPDAGCNLATCAFSQQMASVVLERLSVCDAINKSYQNFAFQVVGTSIRPTIAGCPP